MFDFEIAQYLYRIAFLYENIYNSSYKAKAYFKAAMAIDGYTQNIEKLYKEGSIKETPSIGASIEKSIGEIISTRRLRLLNELLGDIPESVFDLYEFTNIRGRLLKKLIENRVYSVSEVKRVLSANITPLSISDRSDLTKAMRMYSSRRFQYAHVYEIANVLRELILNKGLASRCDFVGGLSVMADTMQGGEIICRPVVNIEKIISAIVDTNQFTLKENHDTSFVVERFSIPFSICTVSSGDYARQDQLIPEKARNAKVSKKNVQSIRGDLHLHTDWSDGIHSIEQMRDYAIDLGYEYIAITDHSQSLRPFGMSELETINQIKEIRKLNQKGRIAVLSGIEVDINPDGSLDLPDNILKEFDIVIASIHRDMDQGLWLMDRLSKALSNPYVDVLGHPTTRLLGKPGKPTVYRDGMILDFDYLLQICKKNNVALEMNYFPERFDLSLENALRAINAGVKLSIGTDAHSMYHMDCVKYAVDRLRYAGVPKESILNCYSLEKFRLLLGKQNIVGFNDERIELKLKNFSHYFCSNRGIISGQKKVVGIDLTGSERKPSGFAVMSGVHVETSVVLTDDEMIDKIKAVGPEVVSIDSPLSLPEGRCCGSKDCECGKYGILRYCEKMLRHFNIGVYPCLIDSMVNLTMRGMRLAKRLRSYGYNVIESYPGVAQDLLQIPRKKNKKRPGYNGYEPLINGLRNFGIEDIRQNISHDEADAITSALVGYFYLADKYVGIGNNKEGYLIVPQLETQLTGKGIIIGLVGSIASGKSTVAEYMRFKYGFDSMRFSQVISELYNVSGRDELQRIGLEIAQDGKRQKALSDYMIQKMKESHNYVIDGLRQFEDYDNLSSKLGSNFILMGIEAPQRARLRRFIELYPNTSEKRFIEMDSHAVESNISYIGTKSQHRINNNKGYSELRNQVDNVMKKLMIIQI